MVKAISSQLREPGRVMWWDWSDDRGEFFFPIRSRQIGSTLWDIREAHEDGLPNLMVTSNSQGILVSGVDPTGVPGIIDRLQELLGNRALNQTQQNPLYLPMEFYHRGEGPDESEQDWAMHMTDLNAM